MRTSVTTDFANAISARRHMWMRDRASELSTEPVKIEITDVPSVFGEIIAKLKDRGFESPVIFGGALRNAYMGIKSKKSDIDIAIPFKDWPNEYKDSRVSEPKMLQIMLSDIPGIQAKSITTSTISFYDKFDIEFKAIYVADNGKEYPLDINISRSDFEKIGPATKAGLDHKKRPFIPAPATELVPYNAQIAAELADAPINGIAIDEHGTVWAHPDFEKHAKEKIYSFMGADYTYNDGKKQILRSQARFEHLSDKIPGLKNQGPYYDIENPPPGAYQYIENNEFDDIMTQHELWLASKGTQGSQADLSDISYSHSNSEVGKRANGKQRDFSNVIAKHAKLTKHEGDRIAGYALFKKTAWNESELEDVTFDCSDLSNADFRHVKKMQQCSFLFANTDGTKFTLNSDLMTCSFGDNKNIGLKNAEFYTPAGKRVHGDFAFGQYGSLTYTASRMQRFANTVNGIKTNEIQKMINDGAIKFEHARQKFIEEQYNAHIA
jgi:hypothetical protein